jgi:tetratricopeptide (TPR) repeat protein
VRVRRVAILPVVGVILVCLGSGRPSARTVPVPAMLDRYASGDFDGVLAELAALRDYDGLLKGLRHDGPAWIEAGGPADRERRALAAATLALEAARADEWNDWKWIEDLDHGLQALHWRPAPLLIKWGSDVFLHDEVPRPIERWWQLAAVAVAERAEDPEFLTSNHFEGTLANPQDEIAFLPHLRQRFPNEPRFTLAHAIAIEWVWASEARSIFDQLKDDEEVGAEATMRLGAVALRRRQFADAVKQLDRADQMTRDACVVYLARFFKGQALERQQRLADAEAAYRGALAVVPHAQSAAVALAALLFKSGQRQESGQIVSEMFAARPQPADPWREYTHADDRFWPRLIRRLHGEIHQ